MGYISGSDIRTALAVDSVVYFSQLECRDRGHDNQVLIPIALVEIFSDWTSGYISGSDLGTAQDNQALIPIA